MNRLDAAYRDSGLVVMGFPCNQFGGQEPGTDADIAKFVKTKFGVTFPMFSKVDVKGPKTHPVFKFLTSHFDKKIRWNFDGKFLVNRQGLPIARFSAKDSWKDVEAAIKSALGQPASKL
mmetsp:Transcript_22246/g.44144  ORF Transcript_22246/g.44144 Transcript_22246/m.44144 type:complete len:119 (+) Transcript_22246:271-627(+)